MFISKFIRSTSVLLLCAPLLFAGEGFAAGKNDKKKKKEKAAAGEKAKKGDKGEEGGGGGGGTYAYGMAGCGLGSLVIKSDTKGGQITASTLNSTGYQTSAITTGSSNCAKEKEAAYRMEQEVFVAANLRNLEVDVSTGGGTYVQAFAEVLGCSEAGQYGEFLEVSRANFKDIFGASDPQVVYTRYMQALRSSAKLMTGCERFVYKS